MIDRVKQAIGESAAFSTNGEFAKALKVLDDALAEAVNRNNPRWVRILSHHAASAMATTCCAAVPSRQTPPAGKEC